MDMSFIFEKCKNDSEFAVNVIKSLYEENEELKTRNIELEKKIEKFKHSLNFLDSWAKAKMGC